MKKKVLIIGYGSVGRKHASILKKFSNISKIYILTKQICLGFKKLNYFHQIKKINPDYIIICSRTADHLKHIRYIEKYFSKKIILVEKPLFHKYKNFLVKNNKIFISYNLRFNPIVSFLKKIKNKNKFYSAKLLCSSYLPDWRKNRNYAQTYSAKKEMGGGVLLDLSHEIDYIQWIFGKINSLEYAKILKISNLNLDVEDYAHIVGRIKKLNITVDLNFFSKLNYRIIFLDSNLLSIQGDLLKNELIIFNKKNSQSKKIRFKKINTYYQVHKSILKESFSKLCSYEQGKELMLLIHKIKKFK
jgi:predicted dehydrogenase